MLVVDGKWIAHGICYFLLVVSTVFPVPGFAKTLKFSPAVLESHLPQSSILALTQDQSGFVWVGSREGLSRWSGRSVRTWRTGASTEPPLPGNIVDQVLEDRFGNVWLRARLWDRHPATVSRLVPPRYEAIRTYDDVVEGSLFLGPDRDVYSIGVTGVSRFTAPRDAFELLYPSLPTSSPVVVAVMTKTHRIFVSLENGEIWQTGPARPWSKVSHELKPRGQVSIGLFVDSADRLWAASGGLGLFSDAEDRFVSKHFPDVATHPDHLPTFVERGDGRLLVGTMFGVVEYAPALDQVTELHRIDVSGVRDDQQWVLSVMLDANQDVWAGSLWGLQQAYSHGGLFDLLIPRRADGSEMTSTVAGIFERGDGTLLISSFGGGHVALDPTLSNPQSIFDAEHHDWIWMMDELPDGSIVAAESGRVLIAPQGNAGIRSVKPVNDEDQTLIGVVAGPDGAIWYLTTSHVGTIKVNGNISRVYKPEEGEPTALAVDDEFVWIGTSSLLLRSPWRESHKFEEVVSGINVTTLRVGTEHIWIGTPEGVRGLHRETLAPRFDIAADKTPSSFVNCILEVDEHELWYSTSRGLVRVYLNTSDTPSGYTQSGFEVQSGVGNREFNRNACAKGGSTRLYFGGNAGVTYFNVADIQLRGARVPLAVTEVIRHKGSDKIQRRGPIAGELVVKPDTHTIELELSALAMPSSQGYRYTTQLEGLDHHWVDQGTRAVVAYTNLAPGRYTFRARTQSPAGVWSRSEVAIPMLVEPAFWQTWWFTSLVLALLVLVPVGFVWLILNRRYQVRLSAARAIEARDQERLRISRDMHDEIGAGLTEIAIMSEIVQREALATSQASESSLTTKAKGIGDRTRSMLSAMSEIIWATDPRNDHSERFVAYLREYCGHFLEYTELSVSYDFPERLVDTTIPSDYRRSVLLILKEALNNIVKHASATRVLIRLSITIDELALTVSDDGIGLEAISELGHGLKNMRDRAVSIGGSLQINGEQGTEIQLVAPLSATQR